MGIFDKILGKEEEAEDSGKEKKPEIKKSPKTKPSPKQPEKKAETKAPKKPVKKAAKVKKEENIAWRILMSTLVTEKSTILGQQNKYVFKVRPDAGKYQIKEAVEGYYGVKVLKVNTVKIKPKVRMHGRTIGFKKAYKKAVVTLQPGDTIAISEGV